MKKGLITVLILLTLLSCSHVQEIEKNDLGKYPYGKPIPIINEFPPAIQRYDSIKAVYHSQIKKRKDPSGGISFVEPDLSTDFIEEFAGAYISTQLYYYDFPYKGIYWKYNSISYPMGFGMSDRLFKLPNLWKFLMNSKGVVLAEVIESMQTTTVGCKTCQQNSMNKPLVIKARILDDILDAYDSDIIYIRHNNLQIDTSGADLGFKLLFSFKARSSVSMGDSVKKMFMIQRDDGFLFVDKDSIIHDPGNVLGIEGKKYIDFRNELIDFAIEHDIRK